MMLIELCLYQNMYLVFRIMPNDPPSINISEAVVQRCSVKKVFLEISQNLQENTCARVSFSIKLQASAFINNFSNFIKKETLAQGIFL